VVSTASQLFEGVAEARMADRMIDKDGAPVPEWAHAYTLRRSDRWRVSLTTPDGEIAAWAARRVSLPSPRPR
jgi:hypothetical protein